MTQQKVNADVPLPKALFPWSRSKRRPMGVRQDSDAGIRLSTHPIGPRFVRACAARFPNRGTQPFRRVSARSKSLRTMNGQRRVSPEPTYALAGVNAGIDRVCHPRFFGGGPSEPRKNDEGRIGHRRGHGRRITELETCDPPYCDTRPGGGLVSLISGFSPRAEAVSRGVKQPFPIRPIGEGRGRRAWLEMMPSYRLPPGSESTHTRPMPTPTQ